ncbi:MAG: GlxA family transcriptional regulator [Massilia sp.]
MVAKVALVVYPMFDILDLAILTVFGVANHFAPGSYAVDVVSMGGGLVPSKSGVSVDTRAFADENYHTVIVAGSTGIPPQDDALVAHLRTVSARAHRMASICTGAFLMAEAGVLDGRMVTTHWAFADALVHRFPNIKIAPDRIFIREGKFWSSAGSLACIDLVLGIIEADLGLEVTRQVSKVMVTHPRRGGGQSQFSAALEIDAKEQRIRRVLAFMKENLREPLTIQQLADSVNWSRRHFSRTFLAETGMSPAKAIEKLRVEAAKIMIENGHSSVARIASHTGFGDDERMRRAFLRVLGESPQKFLGRPRPPNIAIGI